VVQVDHCTFHECGSADHITINAKDVDVTTIQNSIFSSSSTGGPVVDLYSFSQIKFTDIYASGSVGLHGSAKTGAGMLAEDPEFVDASLGNFLLGPTSPLYSHPGSDGRIYGHPRWHDPQYLSIEDRVQPHTFQTITAYPNPFNGSTSIQFKLELASDLRISLVDLRGREIQEITANHFAEGEHRLQLDMGHLQSGVYICRIESSGQDMMTKLTVIK